MSNFEDLKEKFPLSNLYIIRKNVGYILFCLALILFWVFYNHPSSPMRDYQLPGNVSRYKIVITILGVILILRIIYFWLYQAFLKYELRSANFHFIKGVFVKNEASVPFRNITDIFVKRSFLDTIFGLATLEVSSASDYANEFVRIEGFSNDSADRLTKHLRKVLESYRP